MSDGMIILGVVGGFIAYIVIGKISMDLSCSIERKLNPKVEFYGTEGIWLVAWPFMLVVTLVTAFVWLLSHLLNLEMQD